MQITPAIFPDTFEHLHELLYTIEGVSHRVQIDLCDGRLGLEKTWLPYKETHLPHGFSYEFDIMAEDWLLYATRSALLGASRIIFHIDTWEDHDFITLEHFVVSHPHIVIGVSISNNSQVERFVKDVLYIQRFCPSLFVQLMGINKIGAQGQPFDERVLARIEYVRRHVKGIILQVDGAMNPETIFMVRRSGAQGAVIGSYIFGNNNPRKIIDSLHLSFGE